MQERISRTFQPVYNRESRILILGTAPSVKSVESGFYYGHPQNRFWKIMARMCQCEVPKTIEQKKRLLLENHIALWDVIDTCSIIGSSDNSIKNVVVNDFTKLLADSQIQRIYANGSKAQQLYERFVEKNTGIKIIGLPSTSPLNARYDFESLYAEWERRLKG